MTTQQLIAQIEALKLQNETLTSKNLTSTLVLAGSIQQLIGQIESLTPMTFTEYVSRITQLQFIWRTRRGARLAKEFLIKRRQRNKNSI